MENLAGRPEQAKTLVELRAKLKAWMKAQGDAGELQGQPQLFG